MVEQTDGGPLEDGHTTSRGVSWVVLLPVILFALLAILFAFALGSGDPSKLASTLIGKPAPKISLPAMDGLRQSGNPVPGISSKDLADGNVTLVNFFASWCGPCIAEHPLLVELKDKHGVRLFGVNYKDPSPGGRRFLGRYGNPYAAVGIDPIGRAAIEWGVYGMPETFVVDGKGRVAMKWVGPITREVLNQKLLPAIAKAKRETGK